MAQRIRSLCLDGVPKRCVEGTFDILPLEGDRFVELVGMDGVSRQVDDSIIHLIFGKGQVLDGGKRVDGGEDIIIHAGS